MNEYIRNLGPEVWLGIGVALLMLILYVVGAVVGRARERARNIRLYGVPDPKESGILVRPFDGREEETIDRKFDTMISQSWLGFNPAAALAFEGLILEARTRVTLHFVKVRAVDLMLGLCNGRPRSKRPGSPGSARICPQSPAQHVGAVL